MTGRLTRMLGGGLSGGGLPERQGPAAPGSMSPRRYQRRTGKLAHKLASRSAPMLMDTVRQLREQANTSRFSQEGRAAFLAPRLDAVDTAFDRAEGDLARNLAERGLDSSSAAVTGFSGLGAGRAQSRGALVNSLYAAEEERQLGAQGQLRALLAALLGQQQGLGLAAANATRAGDQTDRQLDMQQQAYDDANSFGLGDLFGGILGLGGAAAGLGWNPFGRRRRTGTLASTPGIMGDYVDPNRFVG